MQALIEFLPLIAFLAALSLRGIYFATAVLMVAMPAGLLLTWLLTRRVSTLQIVSTALVLVFGGLTLLLHDEAFIKWKPTVFLWAVAAAFLLWQLLGRDVLVRHFLGPVAAGRRVTPRQWRGLNLLWVVVYAALGALNLLFAYRLPLEVWAKFKVFGLTALLLVFVMGQAVWLQRLPPDESGGGENPPAP